MAYVRPEELNTVTLPGVEAFEQFTLPPPAPDPSAIQPIAGGVTLENGDFISPNYRKGQSGWKIDSRGNAEFASLQVLNVKGTISDTTTVNLTGTLTETTLKTLTIPGGTMNRNGAIRIRILWRGENTGGAAGTQQLRVSFGGTDYFLKTRNNTSGSTVQITDIDVTNRNATNSQLGAYVWYRNDGAASSLVFDQQITSAVDTTVDISLVIKGQLANVNFNIWVDAVYVDIIPRS